MSSSFGILFSVQIAHTYYTGACQDFEFFFPADISRILRERRIIARINKGICYFLCEKNEPGVPVVPVSGITIRIGLKLTNPYFSNFTKLDFKEGTTPLYRNQTVPTALDLPVETLLVRAIFSYTLTKITRPVTVSVKDSQNNIVQTETVTELSDTTPVSLDLTGFLPGLYVLNEKQASSTKKSLCYVDPDLVRQQTFCIVEINLTDALLTPVPPQFTLSFTARAEILKYYIVGKNYSSSELNHLAVSDAGYNEDVRPQVLFSKVGQGSFAATDISPSQLTGPGSAVILFKSQSPVSRLEKARRKIQLSKNTDVILKHLPLPGIERPNSDIIIQISKP